MNEDADYDIDDIYYQSECYQDAPGLLDGHAVLFAEFVVNRGGDALQDYYLPAGKSSDGDLQDGQTSVEQEGQTDDKECEGDLKIHEVECDEETYSSRTCIAHQDFAGVEVEDKVGQEDCHEGTAHEKTVFIKCSVDISNSTCCYDGQGGECAGQAVDTVSCIDCIDGDDIEDECQEEVEDYVEFSADAGYAEDEVTAEEIYCDEASE